MIRDRTSSSSMLRLKGEAPLMVNSLDERSIVFWQAKRKRDWCRKLHVHSYLPQSGWPQFQLPWDITHHSTVLRPCEGHNRLSNPP